MPTPRSRLVPTAARGPLADALRSLRESLEMPTAFTPEAQAEADRAAREISLEGLVDLRDVEFLTVDPPGSLDLDQALHLQRTPHGAVLHYAIADVSAFVTPGGAMDAEARRRGQTMYAPDGRIPLHPTVVSEGAASLLPDQDRRAFVWRFELDEHAQPTATTLTRGIVRSRRQWTYDDAQAAVDAGTAPPTLQHLRWFGAQRAEREAERGGASLNVPEARVVSEDGGYRLERSDGVALEDWNAHVSLLTGMAAADIMLTGGIGILRTMPPARPEDIAEFRAQTVVLGIPWRLDVPYGQYLRELEHSPTGRAIREYAGGLFRGADYVTFDGSPPEQSTQAAIGAPYAHTTAPLRRLVDRWALVICEALTAGREVPEWVRESLPELPALMAQSQQRASRLDAGSIDRVEAAVLSGQEGEVFDGVVLRQRGDGARVQLRTPPVEAKVAGLTAEPGSRVRLRLQATSIAEGTVTLTALP